MADKGIVSKSKVTALADSIRAKAGTTGAMSFDAMKTAVGGIFTVNDLLNTRGTPYLLGGCNTSVATAILSKMEFGNDIEGLFRCSVITKVPNNFDSSKYKQMDRLFAEISTLENVENLDLSNATSIMCMFAHFKEQNNKLKKVSITKMPQGKAKASGMFQNNSGLVTLEGFDFSNLCIVNDMFKNCSSLENDFTVNLQGFDDNHLTAIDEMFYNCSKIKNLYFINTQKVTTAIYAFYNCRSLKTLNGLDLINVETNDATILDPLVNIFLYCSNLTNLTLSNLKANLQVGSGTSWGHLLTLDSLIGLCKECINVGSARTLTVGSANLNKIQNSGKYYKFVDSSVTEIAVDEKGEIEECDSTVTGSFTITDYMAMKNWTLA